MEMEKIPEIKFFLNNPRPLQVFDGVPFDWNFVETHYPDYYHSNLISLSNDVTCVVEYGDVDSNQPVSFEMYQHLKKQVNDYPYGDLSEGHISCFEDILEFEDVGLTLEQVDTLLQLECMAFALEHYQKDNPINPSAQKWLELAKATYRSYGRYTH